MCPCLMFWVLFPSIFLGLLEVAKQRSAGAFRGACGLCPGLAVEQCQRLLAADRGTLGLLAMEWLWGFPKFGFICRQTPRQALIRWLGNCLAFCQGQVLYQLLARSAAEAVFQCCPPSPPKLETIRFSSFY